MLQRLHIINYAIITEVTIDFREGFTAITGETGAGKSILLGALSLILGERAETTTLLNKDTKCIVEGTFSNTKKNTSVQQLLGSLDIDNDDELLIRREIAPNGKTRAFINDTPVNLTQVKQLTSLLVDLHQQFDTLTLGDANFQREVLDSIAGVSNDVEKYQQAYKAYTQLGKEIAQLKTEQTQAQKTLDYNRFLYNELEEVNLQPNELETLTDELKVLNNAEHIKSTLTQVINTLNESEQPLVQQVKQVANLLKNIVSFSSAIEGLQQRLNAVAIDLDDIADELSSTNDKVGIDEEKLAQINEKIDIGYKLLKKHNVLTTNEILTIQEKLANEIELVVGGETLIVQKEKEAQQHFATATAIAATITDKRNKAALPFAKKVNELLYKVGMPNAQVKIEVQPTALYLYGNSTIDFLFDGNKSNRFESIRKVASGGELSRLMLCIKNLVADAMQMPVLIFDEIDTGISGEAARQVGIIMHNLAIKYQIICITHQAQIAAKATTHYFVYKAIQHDKVTTSIKELTTDERITTIAQMLSGEKPTAAAIQNAREMVGN